MVVYDLCIAWNWAYDADFVSLLEQSCLSRGMTLLQIKPDNLPQMLNMLVGGEIHCRVFFDRASDVDSQFLPLVQWVSEDAVVSINPYEQASRTWNKADIHTMLLVEGLNVPPTIILPPFIEYPELPEMDLGSLGEQFTIKPAHGSGGVGVMTNATTWNQALTVRQEHATDHYLLQAHITPVELDSRPAWFRVIFCSGQVFPCWWNPSNHIYAPVTEAEKLCHHLHALDEITTSIANLCGLDLFSTEIALNSDGKFTIVDYVNDQIDLRLQSTTPEGVPDEIVRAVAHQLACHVEGYACPERLPQSKLSKVDR
ncbi:MAG: hypothetical protein C3F13_13740 [Anaerolineales bacterium]|nr:hypothetical protein [Anaerolineae bacterium]PWB51500.1 MAG: hypothetical protein C3F13_13740 [Anaerolineales bacterium]